MATPYATELTRPHWAGSDADIDIHLEVYDGLIEGSFEAQSIFRNMGLTNFKPVQGQSNTWRGDRIGAVSVKGRRSGEELEAERIANEKLVVVVDTTTYTRTPIDYQDEWTAPDFTAEYSREHGTAHAKIFDEAHIIQLIKSGDFVAPASLKGSFKNGIKETMTGYNAATGAAKAAILVDAHKKALTKLINYDMGTGGLVTLMSPDEFSVLMDHDKLMNVEFQGGTGENSFAHRRVAVLNGLRVIETPRFPKAAITDHVLGAAFNLTSAQAAARFVIFDPAKALVTVEAKSMTTRFFDDPVNFQNILDSYALYTVGQRRPDAVAVGYAA